MRMKIPEPIAVFLLSLAAGTGIALVAAYAPVVSAANLTISNTATSTTITGDLYVSGTLSKGSGTFMIDDPLDPKNKLLYHSFVESPDPMDLYDGTTTLDKNGAATVALPGYFLALNKDFRYLATPLLQPMPNLYVESGVQPELLGIFGMPVLHISGGVPGGLVSWQITGIRHDPFIVMNPQPVVVEKGPGQIVNKGEYLCPECYGQK